jgi:hypothetical protein
MVVAVPGLTRSLRAPAQASGGGPSAVAYQIDAQHTGSTDFRASLT